MKVPIFSSRIKSFPRLSRDVNRMKQKHLRTRSPRTSRYQACRDTTRTVCAGCAVQGSNDHGGERVGVPQAVS